jgi:hypothetical protein
MEGFCHIKQNSLLRIRFIDIQSIINGLHNSKSRKPPHYSPMLKANIKMVE